MGKKEKEAGGAGATSNNVYVLDKEFAWVPARLIEQSGDTARVSIPSYSAEEKILCDGGSGATSWREESVKLKFYPGKALPLQNVDKAGNLLEKEDMVDLPFLHEVNSLRCLFLFAKAAFHMQLGLTNFCFSSLVGRDSL